MAKSTETTKPTRRSVLGAITAPTALAAMGVDRITATPNSKPYRLIITLRDSSDMIGTDLGEMSDQIRKVFPDVPILIVDGVDVQVVYD
jgi:uncharacterized protein (DUF1501 family)